MKAASATGVAKSDILVFEDSAKGIEAAKKAGLTVWAIRDQHYGIDQSKADKLVDNLEDTLTYCDFKKYYIVVQVLVLGEKWYF